MTGLRNRTALAATGTVYLKPKRGFTFHQVSVFKISGSAISVTVKVKAHEEGEFENIENGEIVFTDPRTITMHAKIASIEITPSNADLVFNAFCN